MGSNCCKGDAAGGPVRSGSSMYTRRSRGGNSLEDRFTSAVERGVVRLTVTSAQADDAGVYTLEASNEAGTDTARVRLEVEDPPTFLRRLQDLTVKVGSRTRFLVEIASSTECQVTWYRNERRLLEAERVTLAHEANFWCAEVAPVSIEDAGRWTCTAENVAGRTSCSGHLNVLVPKAYKRPEFVEELRALLTEQGTVSLECKVVGVPTPVLRWFKDSKEIKAGDVFALTANAEDPTSLGTYTCEAVNCMGRAYSSSKVHVVGRASREGSMPSAITQEPPPIFTREMEDQSVKICGQLRLSCRALVPPWPRSVVWYNKEGKVEAGERHQMIEDGAGGYMIEIASSEWCDEGEWKCVATSAGGRVSVSTCHVTMDVPHNYRAPRFMESLSAVLTEEGLVSFECKVVGFPTPLLRWFKDGHELKPGDVYHLTGTNSLGSYCCIARNCMGQASSSAELTVEDIQSQLNEDEKLQLFSKNQAPKFILGLTSVEAKIDEPFRFNVKVNTPPEPSVSWYRDEQPVDDSTRCHLGQEDKGIFFIDIQNLEFMDQAEWKCVAMNDYGHSVTSCFLKLMIPRHYKKPRFLENLQAILSDEGAVNLECKVIGVPQPILKWYKDGEELKPGDIHRIISGQDGTCCLGTYTCEAQNCMGIASSSASLLGYDDPAKVKANKITAQQSLERNLSLSTIHEERTSQMYDTPVGDITLDDKGEISFSFDGKEVSVSLYETPDLTEEEALQIVEMYADQLSENVTEHNVVELPPLRFVKETSTSGNLLMEAIIIDVSPEYFVSPEEDLRTEADVDDISNADEIGPQLSLDQDISGENYLEKTMALISEEKSDIPKILRRKKSESQRSGEDFFSLSRDQSLSEGKDDDTHVLSASDLESFASAKSSAKNISKPSTKEGAEPFEHFHKTVIQENIEVINKEIFKTPIAEHNSEKDAIIIDDEDVNMNIIHIDQHFATKMIYIGNSLDEIINKAQIVEKDIILKCELMSSAIAASKSLEVINSLISPLLEIQSTANTIGDPTAQNVNTMSSCLKQFVNSLKSLQQASTMIEKCIEIKSESKTLVQKTCSKLIENCGDDLQNVMQELKDTLMNYTIFVDEKTKTESEIDNLTNEIKTALILSSDTIKTQNLLTEAGEITQINEPSAEMKHVKDTQKVIFLFKNTLNSLLCIVDNAEKCNSRNELKIKKIDVVLNDMSSTVFELQTVLERIESLSVKETCSSFTTYNTEIIESVMESVLKLRSSFEELSQKPSEDSESLKVAFASIKNILCEIYANVNAIEYKVGSFDILQSENKLDVLQKIAQSLISLESNLVNLDSIPEIKSHFCTFHKNLTKVLEKVLENNNRKQYFALVEICDTVNRVNNNIKLIDSNNKLAFTSLCNSIETIRGLFDKTIFDNELNDSVISNIKDILICLGQALNIAEEVSFKIDSEHALEKNIDLLDFTKTKLLIEHIDCTIATISSINVLDTTQELKEVLSPALENIIPCLEEIKKSIALIQNVNINKDESLSDLAELSFSEAVANPLCELNQNIVILNQHILYHIHEIKNENEISYKFAETLHELHTTLEVLQQNVISQYDEDVLPYEVSVNVASAIQNLQSCIVMVEENAGAEPIDDMSTLEDISGIKTSAEIISEEHILTVPAASGTLTSYFTSSLEQECIPFTSAEALYNLNEHITVLKNPEIMDALDTLSDVSDLTSLKTVNMNLQELCLAIEEILHPITLESTTHFNNIGNTSKLLSIAQPMQELSKALAVFDVQDVQIYEEILEKPSDKVYSLIQDVSNFREQLRQCIETVISPLETVNMSADVSNKVKNVRDMCSQLKYILKSTTCLSNNLPMRECDLIVKLENIVDDLLQATETINEFSMKQIKTITEELYKLTISVQDSLIHFVPQSADKLAQEVKLVQCVDELEKSIAVLEQYEFIDLSKASELSFNTTSEFVVQLQTEPLYDIEVVVENIVHILQDQIQESKEDSVDNFLYIEEFFKNCKNEFVIIRCLISHSLTHKKLVRVLQEVINLEKLIDNFKSSHSNLIISNDFNTCLNNFFTYSTECLHKMKESFTKIVGSQSEVLFKIPLRKLNETVTLIEKKVPNEPMMSEILNRFNVLLKSVYNDLENLELSVLSELKTSKPMHSSSDEVVEKIKDFVCFADSTRSVLSINEKSNIMLAELLLSIQSYNEFENASPTGVRLILLKCLSECCDIINKYLIATKPNEANEDSHEDLSRALLKPILNEALVHLKEFNQQLNIIQENILSGTDQDTISIDRSSTKSLVQSVKEACKEVSKVGNDLVSEMNLDFNKQEYNLIQEVDNEIHSIQENMKNIHQSPIIKDVQVVSETLSTMDMKLQSILSIEPVEHERDLNTEMSLLNKVGESKINELPVCNISLTESENTEGTKDQQTQSLNINQSESSVSNNLAAEKSICQVFSSEIESNKEAKNLCEQKLVANVEISQQKDQMLQMQTDSVKAFIVQDLSETQGVNIEETDQEKSLIAKQAVCQVSSSKLESVEETTNLIEQKKLENVATSQQEDQMLQLQSDIVETLVAQDVTDTQEVCVEESIQEKSLNAEQTVCQVSSSKLERAEEAGDLIERKKLVNVAKSQQEDQTLQSHLDILETLVAQNESDTQEICVEESIQEKSLLADQAVCQVSSSKLESAEEAAELIEQNKLVNVATSHQEDQMLLLQSDIVETVVVQDVTDTQEVCVEESFQEKSLNAKQTVCQVSSSKLEPAEEAGDLIERKKLVNVAKSQQEDQMLQLQSDIVETSVAQDVFDTREICVDEFNQEKSEIADQAVCQVSSSKLETAEEATNLIGQKKLVNLATSKQKEQMLQLQSDIVETLVAQDVTDTESGNIVEAVQEKILIAEQAFCQVSSSKLESEEEAADLIEQKKLVNLVTSQQEYQTLQSHSDILETLVAQNESDTQEICVEESIQEKSLLADQAVCQVSSSKLESAEEAAELIEQNKLVKVATSHQEEQMLLLQSDIVETLVAQDVSDTQEVCVEESIQEKSLIANQAVCQVSSSKLENAEKATDLIEHKQLVNVATSQQEDQMLQLQSDIVETLVAQDVTDTQEVCVEEFIQKKSLNVEQAVCQVSSSKLESAEEATDLIEQKKPINVAISQQEDQTLKVQLEVVETLVAQDMTDTQEICVEESIQEKSLNTEQAVCQVSSSKLESAEEATDLLEQKKPVNVATSQQEDQMLQSQTEVVETLVAQDMTDTQEICVEESIQEKSLNAEQAVCQVSSSKLESAEEARDLIEQKKPVNVATSQQEDQMLQSKSKVVETLVAQDVTDPQGICVEESIQEKSLNAEQTACQVSSSKLESAEEATDLIEQKKHVNVAISQQEDQTLKLQLEVVETLVAQDMTDTQEICVEESIQEKSLNTEQAVCQVSSSKLKSAEEATDLIEQKKPVNVAISQQEDQTLKLQLEVVETLVAQDMTDTQEISVKESIQEKSLNAKQAVCQVSSSKLESAEEARDLIEQKKPVNVATSQQEDQMLQSKSEVVETLVALDVTEPQGICVEESIQEKSLNAEQAACQVSSSKLESAEEATDLIEQKNIINFAISQQEDQMLQLQSELVKTLVAQDMTVTQEICVEESIQEKSLNAEQAVCQVSSSKLESAEEARNLIEQKKPVNVATSQQEDQMLQSKSEVVETLVAQDVTDPQGICVEESIQENSLNAEQAACQVSSSKLENAEEATDLMEQKNILNVAISQQEDQMLQLQSEVVETLLAQDVSNTQELCVEESIQEKSLNADQAVCQVSSSKLESAEETTDLIEQKKLVNVATSQQEDQMLQSQSDIVDTLVAQDVTYTQEICVEESIQEKSLNAEQTVCQVSSSKLESEEEATDLFEQKNIINVAISQQEDQMLQLKLEVVETLVAQDVTDTQEVCVKESIQEKSLFANQAVCQVSSSKLEIAEEATDLIEHKQLVNVATSQQEDQMLQLQSDIVETLVAQDVTDTEGENVIETVQGKILIAEQAVCQVSSNKLENAEEATDLVEQKKPVNVATSQQEDQMLQSQSEIVETLVAQDVTDTQGICVEESIQEKILNAEQALCQVSSSKLESTEEATDLIEQKNIINVAISQQEDQMFQLQSEVVETLEAQDVTDTQGICVEESIQEKSLNAEQALCQVSSSKLESTEEATDLIEQKNIINVAISQQEDQMFQLQSEVVENLVAQDVTDTQRGSVVETVQEKSLISGQAVCQVSSSKLESAEEAADLIEQKKLLNVATSQQEDQMLQLQSDIVESLVAQDVTDTQAICVEESIQEKSINAEQAVCQVFNSKLVSAEEATDLIEQKKLVNVATSQQEDQMLQVQSDIVKTLVAQDLSDTQKISVEESIQEKGLIAEQAVCQVSSIKLESAEKAIDLTEQKEIAKVVASQPEDQISQLQLEIVETLVAQDVTDNQRGSVVETIKGKSVITEQSDYQISTSELDSVKEITDLRKQKQVLDVAVQEKCLIADQAACQLSSSKLESVEEFTDMRKQKEVVDIAVSHIEEQIQPKSDLNRLITNFKQLATNEFSEEVSTLSSLMKVDSLTESVTIVKDLLVNIASSSIQNTPSLEFVTYDLMEKLSSKQLNVIKDIQSALTVIQCDPMENTEKIAINKVAKHIVKLATQLQQDLSYAMQYPSVVVLEKISDLLQQSNQIIPTKERLQHLLKEVNNRIKESQNNEKTVDPESLRDVMDEIQTVIIKIKRDIDRVPNQAINETLEDLECSVRSVQLQNIEQSKVELIKEVSDGLKTLLNNIEADSKVYETIIKSPEILDEIVTNCNQCILHTLNLLELSSKSDINNFPMIMSNLKDVKEHIQSLRLPFISSSEEVINKGIEILLKLEQTEDKIQLLQKKLISENKLKPETGKCIMNAVSSVTKSIVNMRSTLLSIQKQYLYESYGKPLDNLLQSLRSISLICQLEDENKISEWKSLAMLIRKTLGHFEDIKFYINLDKSARIPCKSAVTEHVINELKASIVNIKFCKELLENKTISIFKNETINLLNDQSLTLKSAPTIAVNEKIPLFIKCSAKLRKFTENVKIALQDLRNTSDVITADIPQHWEVSEGPLLQETHDINVLTKNNATLSNLVTNSSLENTVCGGVQQNVQEDEKKTVRINSPPSELQAECIPCDVINEESFNINETNISDVAVAKLGTYLLNECHIEDKMIYEKEDKANISDIITEHVVEGTSIIEEKEQAYKTQIYTPSLVDAPVLTTKDIHDVKNKKCDLVTPDKSLTQVTENLTKDKTSTASQKNVKILEDKSECNNNIEVGDRNEVDNSTTNILNLTDPNKNSFTMNDNKKSNNIESTVEVIDKIDKDIKNDNSEVKVQKDEDIITKDDERTLVDVLFQPLVDNNNKINQPSTIALEEVTKSGEIVFQSDNTNIIISTIDMAKDESLKNILVTDDSNKIFSNVITSDNNFQSFDKPHSSTESNAIVDNKKEIQDNIKEEEKALLKHVEDKNDANKLNKKSKVAKKISIDKKKLHDKGMKKSKQELVKINKNIENEEVQINKVESKVPSAGTSLALDNSEKKKTEHTEYGDNEFRLKEVIKEDNSQPIREIPELQSYKNKKDQVEKINKDLAEIDLCSNVEKNMPLQNIDMQLESTQNWRRNVDNDFENLSYVAKDKDTNLKNDNKELNYKFEMSRKDLVKEDVMHSKQRNVYSAYVEDKLRDNIYTDTPVSKSKPTQVENKYSHSLSQPKDIKYYNRYTLEQCADTNKVDFDRPSNYNQRNSGLNFTEPFHIPNNHIFGRCDPIYKAKSLVPESRLRSKTPGTTLSSEDLSERQRLRIKKNASSRAFSVEKSSSVPRDLKRKPVFSTYLTDRTAVEGSRVKLTCSVLSSNEPKVTWYRNGNLLDDKLKYRTKFSDGLITLEVLNAVPTDSAEYSCVVENDNGAISCNANLKVYPCFESSPIPPTFTRSIRDSYHIAENELVLECRIRGQPLPIITWLKDDVPISSNERYQAYYLADGVCRLCINVPTSDDSGKYTCRAENSVWSDQITHIVNFTGKESRLDLNLTTTERTKFARQALESRRPHFSNVLTDHAVSRGGTIGLQVEIRGAPTRVEWLCEGTYINESYRNARTFVEQGLYTLAVSDVTEKESGLYTCRAWSSHGNVDMNASVTVVQPTDVKDGKAAIIVSRPEKDVLISVGEDLNVSFRVQGEPKPKVIWMKGTREITNNDRVCKMTSDDYMKFTLKRSVVSDAGTYCVLARNVYGCDRAFVTVVVRQRASSENLIRDWTYPSDDSHLAHSDRSYKPLPSRIPGEPSAIDGGDNWLSLCWPKPDSGVTPVLAYKVEVWRVGAEGGARWSELGITPLNSYDVFNLKRGDQYHFRVTPRNRYGWGETVQTTHPIGVGLSGDRPEFVELLPGQLKVMLGETATLGCRVQANPLPDILWTKNGHEVEESDKRISLAYDGHNCRLTIDQITMDDEGRYSCEATNGFGRTSTYARLAVVTDKLIWEADAKLKRERSAECDGEYPPQFTLRLRDRRVQASYPVRLTCQVIGSPTPEVTWFKNGVKIHRDDRHTMFQDEHFHTLEIAPTTLEDGGVYEAMARNTRAALSCRCSLVVDKGIRAYVAPEFCCGLQPMYRYLEGEELRVSAVVEAYPSVGVSWYRDGIRLRPSRRTIMTLDRDGVVELALASVTPRDAGVYSCTASNEVGTATTSGRVDVIEGVGRKDIPDIKQPVMYPPDVPYSKEPMFVRKPRSSEAREGDTVIIECEVVGDPKPDVFWLRDFLKPDYYRDATHFRRIGSGPEYRLEIPHAKFDHTGAYSVLAKNTHGEAKAVISLQILAKDPDSTDSHNVSYGRVETLPRFVRELCDVVCCDGDVVQFQCEVSGTPFPDIKWVKYNQVIHDNDDFELTCDENEVILRIKRVTAEDEGVYVCEASNVLGRTTSSACLIVYPPGEPNMLSQQLRRPPAFQSAQSTPRSTPRATPARCRSLSRTPVPETRRLYSPSRRVAPKFYTYPHNKVVEEGGYATFRCAVTGHPSPWTSWDKDGVPVTPSTRITIKEKDDTRLMELEEVTIEDAGLYRIVLENDHGRSEASARLDVITRRGKYYGGVRSYSVSPRRATSSGRRLATVSRHTPVPDSGYDRREMLDDRLRVIDHENDTHCEKPKDN